MDNIAPLSHLVTSLNMWSLPFPKAEERKSENTVCTQPVSLYSLRSFFLSVACNLKGIIGNQKTLVKSHYFYE